MKRQVGQIITGILIVTAICSGSLGLVMESYAHGEGDMKVSHAMEHESVNCCDDHEQEVKLFIQQSREEYEMNSNTTAIFPRKNFLRLAEAIQNKTVAGRSVINKANQHLKTIVLLE